MIPNPFPRGLVMHLGANKDYPLGRPEHYDKWIRHLHEMGFDGVKVLLGDEAMHDPGEGEKRPVDAVRRLVSEGFVVVVRLYRHQPNPGILTSKHLRLVEHLVRMGVRFFETNNEPNLLTEWKDEQFLPDAAVNVGHAWWIDANNVIQVGVYAGMPACSPGGDIDDIAFMDDFMGVIAGHAPDGFLDNVWIAVHNYVLNHPLDYPDDVVNRTGVPISEEEYKKLGWYGRPRESVNAERAAGKHVTSDMLTPGESNSFRKWEALNALAQKHFHRSFPVISTEGTAVMDRGHHGDPRYPAVDNETYHAELSVETARRMMWGLVPDYAWANCCWLMANREMENPTSAGFESHAWFPINKPDGIEAVRAYKEMPKQDRPMDGTPPPEGEPMTDEQIRHVAWNKLGVPFNPTTAFYGYAKAHDLGRPLTAEWDDGINRLQLYDGAIVVCPINQWDKVRHVSWL